MLNSFIDEQRFEQIDKKVTDIQEKVDKLSKKANRKLVIGVQIIVFILLAIRSFVYIKMDNIENEIREVSRPAKGIKDFYKK